MPKKTISVPVFFLSSLFYFHMLNPAYAVVDLLPDIRARSPTSLPAAKVSTEPSQNDSPTQKVRVELHKQDKDPHWDRPYLFAAYLLFWTVLMAYVFIAIFRQRALAKQLEQLQQQRAQSVAPTEAQ